MYYPLIALHFWPCNFHQQVQDSTSRKSGSLLEDQEKSGKIDVFRKKSGKSKCKFLTLKKIYMHAEMCVVELYMTVSCIYDAIICI